MEPKWITERLEKLRAEGLERFVRPSPATGGVIEIDGRRVLNFAGNDYLDLARHPHVIERAREALEQWGAGSTASRLLAGTLPIHEELEARLARHKGYPAALFFGSGYLTNAAVIPVLAGRGDYIFADRLIHASMIDACRLSGARLIRFAHNDPADLRRRLERHADAPGRRLVLTESVFSMDGDIAPLEEIAAIAERFDALLMVDEAHATGTFGPAGAGLVREYGLERRVAVSMGTLSKALGGYGGFIACGENLRRLLINSARAFIYTTAPPPAVVGAALGALDVLEAEPERGNLLQNHADCFRRLLRNRGFDTLRSRSQIVPVLVGDNRRAVEISKRLREKGIIAPAIRPPTVPPGTARLRFSLTLAHTADDLAYAARTLAEIFNPEEK